MYPKVMDGATQLGKSNHTNDNSTGLSVRLGARTNTYASLTSGVAPTFIQANIIVIPSRYAADFRLLCQRNPVPCPLIAESESVGKWDRLVSHIEKVSGYSIAGDLDIRRDAPRYMVYENGVLVSAKVTDVVEEWTHDHVAFLIGCSYSFESALSLAGLTPRHIVMGGNVPMYCTKVPLCPAGIFTNTTYVVSMRPYKKSEIEMVRGVTRPYAKTHGEPIAWGWDAVHTLGIADINAPEWGDSPLMLDGRPLTEEEGDDVVVPIFWGCGVTPQEAVMRAKLPGTVMAHAPGHMLVLDIRDLDIV
jgi:uncharacterized protein YcsI (UPF0317 family)